MGLGDRFREWAGKPPAYETDEARKERLDKEIAKAQAKKDQADHKMRMKEGEQRERIQLRELEQKKCEYETMRQRALALQAITDQTRERRKLREAHVRLLQEQQAANSQSLQSQMNNGLIDKNVLAMEVAVLSSRWKWQLSRSNGSHQQK